MPVSCLYQVPGLLSSELGSLAGSGYTWRGEINVKTSWTLKYFKHLTDQIVEEVPGAAPVGDHQGRQDRAGPGHVCQLQAQAGLGLQETHVCTV